MEIVDFDHTKHNDRIVSLMLQYFFQGYRSRILAKSSDGVSIAERRRPAPDRNYLAKYR